MYNTLFSQINVYWSKEKFWSTSHTSNQSHGCLIINYNGHDQSNERNPDENSRGHLGIVPKRVFHYGIHTHIIMHLYHVLRDASESISNNIVIFDLNNIIFENSKKTGKPLKSSQK